MTFYPARPVTVGDVLLTDGPFPASNTVVVTTGVAFALRGPAVAPGRSWRAGVSPSRGKGCRFAS